MVRPQGHRAGATSILSDSATKPSRRPNLPSIEETEAELSRDFAVADGQDKPEDRRPERRSEHLLPRRMCYKNSEIEPYQRIVLRVITAAARRLRTFASHVRFARYRSRSAQQSTTCFGGGGLHHEAD